MKVCIHMEEVKLLISYADFYMISGLYTKRNSNSCLLLCRYILLCDKLYAKVVQN
jgi:hypothetical protein